MINNCRLTLFWLVALFWGMAAGVQAQPTIGEMVGVNVKPQQNTTRINRVAYARSFQLFADDIGSTPGGGGKPALSRVRPTT
jgi:hypothetical protein